MTAMRFAWWSLPKPARREAWRLARTDRPHPDPVVQDAAQSGLRGTRRAVRVVGLAFLAVWVYRGLLDDVPEAVGLTGLVCSGLLLMAGGRNERMRNVAAAQWPALAARRQGPPHPVRLRLPALWGLQGILAVTAAPMVIVLGALWFSRRSDGPDQVMLMVCGVVAAALLLVGFAVALRRRRRPAVEVDHDGVRLPVHGLTVPWEHVAEVTVRPHDRRSDGPIGLALRLRDPGAVWSSRPTPWWRRLLWGRPGTRSHLMISDVDVREPVFAAYQAALAFHTAHLAAAGRSPQAAPSATGRSPRAAPSADEHASGTALSGVGQEAGQAGSGSGQQNAGHADA